TGRFECQGSFANADIFGKTTHTAQDVSVYFVSRFQPGDVLAGHFNPPCDVRSKYVAAWLAKPAYAGIQGFAYQALPVRSIQGHRLKFDQHFIVRRGRLRYLFDLKNVRWSVFCVNNRFHELPLRRPLVLIAQSTRSISGFEGSGTDTKVLF